jgi:hypothetical protein
MKALLLALSCLLLFAVACGGAEESPSAAGSSSNGSSLGPDTALETTSAPGTDTLTDALSIDNKLVISTTIDLEVKALRDSYSAIIAAARDLGGFVAEASFSDDGTVGSAFLRLRVPSTQHDELLDRILTLQGADVRREDSTAKEVTEEYTDLESHVATLQATEAQYKQLLERAASTEDVLKVSARLDEVRGDIERVQGRMNLLDDKADFATVIAQLSLPPVAAATEEPSTPLDVLDGALNTSLQVARVLANAFVVVFIAGLWIVPGTVVILLIRKRFRRQFEAVKTWLG